MLLALLEEGLSFLSGSARDLPARQQTLRATIAWSYELLAPQEQQLFRRLSVFVDGWDWQAAEQVCTPLIRAQKQLHELNITRSRHSYINQIL